MGKNLYEGVKVLDMSSNYAGPITGAFLADYGADVIHIERPVLGDDNRFFAPRVDGVSFAHMQANRGKKSLVLDLKDPRATEIVKTLAKDADILLQSFRPGVMDRLGLGYEDIKAVNPKIIYLSVSAYGQTGPYSKRPGYDVIAQAVSGLMYMTGEQDGPPVKIGTAIGDFMGGIVGFGMVGNAMYYREKTGKGMHIDLSLARMLMWTSAKLDFVVTGKMDHRNGNHHTTLAPYGIFTGKNNESIIIGALSQGLWTKLCNVMGKPQYINDPKFVTNDKRCENLKEMVVIIEDWLKSLDSVRVAEKQLLEAGVPCAKVYDHKDIYEDPHFNACGWLVDFPAPDAMTSIDKRKFPADPIGFSEFEPVYKKAPGLGQHNHEILEKLGYTAEQVDEMEAEWDAKARKPKK